LNAASISPSQIRCVTSGAGSRIPSAYNPDNPAPGSPRGGAPLDAELIEGSACVRVDHRHLPCRAVVRRSAAWDISLAMPASPPPTNSRTSRSTPSSGPAAIGCSPRPPAAPAATAQPSSNSLISSGPAPLVVWKLDRLGRSLRHLVDDAGPGCPAADRLAAQVWTSVASPWLPRWQPGRAQQPDAGPGPRLPQATARLNQVRVVGVRPWPP
jgi:hypothetical protein